MFQDISAEAAIFDNPFIEKRSRDETPSSDAPLAAKQDSIRYDAAAQAALLNYNLTDSSI